MNRIAVASLITIALAPLQFAAAQTTAYPAKSVRIIAPFPPGGSVDTVARMLGMELSKSLGQQVIVDNRSGASGNIGSEIAKNAAPDGYTLLVNTLPFVTNQFLYSRVPYDPISDFAPISQLSSSASIITVHPSLPVRSVRELLALAKAKPGALNYASAGAATNPHLVVIHFKGGGPGLAATMAGETQVTFSNIPETVPLVKANRLRALGVTSLKRAAIVPDVPTVAEAGLPGYEFTTWHALVAPRGTPGAVVATLNDKVRSVLRTPEQRQRWANRGLDVIASTPDELGAHLRNEVQKWGKVIKERGMRAE